MTPKAILVSNQTNLLLICYQMVSRVYKTKTKPKRIWLFLCQKVSKGIKTKVKPKKQKIIDIIILKKNEHYSQLCSIFET